jgi:hypothetical protein
LCPNATPKVKEAADGIQLPPGKDIVDVYSDFMRYMLECTKQWFEDQYAEGDSTWRRLIPQAHFIIGHPNGWEGAQQAKLRKAAVKAEFVPDNIKDRARIHFVTEGEASLHFCLEEGLVKEVNDQVCLGSSPGAIH